MGHRFFGKGRKLRYLVRWKRLLSAADDTWEAAGQVFAPQLLEAYHWKHPKSQPFPHKKGAAGRGKTHPLPLFSCLTTPATPGNKSPASLSLELPLPDSPTSSLDRARIQTSSTMSLHTAIKPFADTCRGVRPPGRTQSPPVRPCHPPGPSAPGEAPITSGRSPKSLPAPSSSVPRPP